MSTFKTSYLFDTTVTSRVIVTYDAETGKFSAAVRLVGAAAGMGTFSTGATPEIAIQRALDCVAYPQRWRQLKF